MKEIKSKEAFYNAVKEGRVLVDFWAPWCNPCKAIRSLLEEVKDQVQIIAVNIDEAENSDLASEYQIRGLPTLMLFEDGRPVATKVGLLNSGQLQELLNATH